MNTVIVVAITSTLKFGKLPGNVGLAAHLLGLETVIKQDRKWNILQPKAF